MKKTYLLALILVLLTTIFFSLDDISNYVITTIDGRGLEPTTGWSFEREWDEDYEDWWFYAYSPLASTNIIKSNGNGNPPKDSFIFIPVHDNINIYAPSSNYVVLLATESGNFCYNQDVTEEYYYSVYYKFSEKDNWTVDTFQVLQSNLIVIPEYLVHLMLQKSKQALSNNENAYLYVGMKSVWYGSVMYKYDITQMIHVFEILSFNYDNPELINNNGSVPTEGTDSDDSVF